MYLTKEQAALRVLQGGLIEYNYKGNPPDSGWVRTGTNWPMQEYNAMFASDNLNFRIAPPTEAKFNKGEFVLVVAQVDSQYYRDGGLLRRYADAFSDRSWALFARVQRVWYDGEWKYDLEDGSGLVQTVYEPDIRKVE